MRRNFHRKYTKRHLKRRHHFNNFERKRNYSSIFWIIFFVAIFLIIFYWEDISNKLPNEEIGHLNPINKSYPVNFNGLNKIEITLHNSVYDYFVDEDSFLYEGDSYEKFLTNKNDEYIIKEIVNQTINATNSEGDKAVRTLVMFVQKIPYDWESLTSQSYYMKYPYETLYTNMGICSEKSILLAKLLDELGYGVALFNYVFADHMAVGIACPYEKSNFKTGYCFIEATDIYPIGEIPQEYVGGADIRNTIPQIIIISEGKVYSPII